MGSRLETYTGMGMTAMPWTPRDSHGRGSQCGGDPMQMGINITRIPWDGRNICGISLGMKCETLDVSDVTIM